MNSVSINYLMPDKLMENIFQYLKSYRKCPRLDVTSKFVDWDGEG